MDFLGEYSISANSRNWKQRVLRALGSDEVIAVLMEIENDLLETVLADLNAWDAGGTVLLLE